MRLIVFDLDHTLLRANSSFRFGRYLYEKNDFSFWTLLACLTDYARHKWFGMSLEQLHHDSFSRLFKGRPEEEIRAHAIQFLSENLYSLVYEPVRRRLKDAQDAGHHVLLLSSSPDFLVGEIARRLSVEKWKSTTYEVNGEGVYSKISHVMGGEEKALYVSRLAKELSIPLNSVTVYSDSSLDLPLLTLAGKAICVAPNEQLKRICMEKGWEIIN